MKIALELSPLWSRFGGLLVVVLLSTVRESPAVTMGFVNETPWSFEWNSGVVDASGEWVMARGEHWMVGVEYFGESSMSYMVVRRLSDNAPSSSLTPFHGTRAGKQVMLSDAIDFELMDCTYSDVVFNQQIGNIHVNAATAASAAREVPESGVTWALLAGSVFGLVGVRRWMSSKA